MKLLEPDIEVLRPLPPAVENPLPRRLLQGVALLWLLTSIYIVPAVQQAVVTRSGAVVEPRVTPGIHLSLPWPIDRVTRLKVQQLQRLVIGGALSDNVTGRGQPLISQFLTGDQNILHLRVVLQYSVGVPADYLYQAQDIGRLITAVVESELTRRIATRTVDAVLTTEKAAIQDEVQAATQKIINDYRAGVLLASINMESASPPPEAAGAFRDVASARADSSRIVNESQGYANDLLPKARGQAQQMLESASAYKQKKINEALGDAARFSQVAVEYAKAADVNGRRIYMEAMEQILPRIRKLMVDKNGNLDLTIVRSGGEKK
ncbi:MAG TPA: FtsH protease activity modulator HflK [Bryobacteraceae bacterium]|nr:FtsH protease activity modulator HflK [Bryobacteraceae bacterium]